MNDTIIPRLGFYTVGLKSFNNKISALAESKTSGLPTNWIFNNQIFNDYNWITPPTLSLTEVYKKRALQLREKYDYIVLHYSAGSDSHNILRTFIDNNIRLDEICVRMPWKRSQYTVSTNLSADNHMSEWDLNILPDILELKQSHPEIHVELYDHSDDTLDFYDDKANANDPWFLRNMGSHLSPAHASRWKIIDRHKKLFYDKGIKGCQLYGVDKPRVCFTNNSFYVFYLDIIASTIINFDSYDDYFSPAEFFYWTPDMPELVKTQAHYIMNHMRKNQQLLPMISPAMSKSIEMRNAYEETVRNLIYPHWDKTRFQAYKPTSSIWCELDNWIFDKRNARSNVSGLWNYGLDYLEQIVDQKYIVRNSAGERDGVIGMTTPFYKIGDLNV